MRYERTHKANTRKKIVEDAARRFRAEGLSGASVATVMQDTGLTHGGFYKHFPSKADLLIESIGEAFDETAAWLVRVAKEAPAGSEWKAIVAAYLSLEHCDRPESGCPLASLTSELARSEKHVRTGITAAMVNYKNRLVRFMPGKRMVDRERAVFAIFSTMIGAVALARMMPDTAMRKRVLDTAKDFLLRFGNGGFGGRSGEQKLRLRTRQNHEREDSENRPVGNEQTIQAGNDLDKQNMLAAAKPARGEKDAKRVKRQGKQDRRANDRQGG